MKKLINSIKIEISKNPKFIAAVQKYLNENSCAEFISNLINNILKDYTVYLWGGAVRDPIVKMEHGLDKMTKDFDFLVDDSRRKINFESLLKGMGKIFYTRFGAPRLKLDNGFTVDIVPFSNAPILEKYREYPISLETMLRNCDITTSAIAYGFKDRTIHSARALEGIRKKELDILYPDQEERVLMPRIVIQADKLKFKIGSKAIKFIRENYSLKLDKDIKDYLKHKNLEHLFGFVIKNLRKIKAQRS